MDRHHYMKKGLLKSVQRCCVGIIALVPIAHFAVDDTSTTRAIVFVVTALIVLSISIKLHTDLAAKEPDGKA